MNIRLYMTIHIVYMSYMQRVSADRHGPARRMSCLEFEDVVPDDGEMAGPALEKESVKSTGWGTAVR